LIFASYNYYDENKKLKKAQEICKEHFKTSDKRCINSYWNYAFVLSKELSNKGFASYKKQVDELLSQIEEINKISSSINFKDYSFVTTAELSKYRFYDKNNPINYKKIVLSSSAYKSNLDSPFSCWQRNKDKFYICLADTEDKNKISVEIKNINNFPKIKKIIDNLETFNFPYYKKTVFGRIVQESAFEFVFEADYIKLETFKVPDDEYKSSLRLLVDDLKKKDFIEYMKNKYPKK